MPIDTLSPDAQAVLAKRKHADALRKRMILGNATDPTLNEAQKREVIANRAQEVASARGPAQDLSVEHPLIGAAERYSPELAAQLRAQTALRTRQELGAYAGQQMALAESDARVPIETMKRTAVAGAAAAEMQPQVLAEGIAASQAKTKIGEGELALAGRKQDYTQTSGDRGYALEEEKTREAIRANAETQRVAAERAKAEVAKTTAETGGIVADTAFKQSPAVAAAMTRGVQEKYGIPPEGSAEATTQQVEAKQARRQAALSEIGLDPDRLESEFFTALRPGLMSGLNFDVGLVGSAINPALGSAIFAQGDKKLADAAIGKLAPLDSLPPDIATSIAIRLISAAKQRGVEIQPSVMAKLRQYLPRGQMAATPSYGPPAT